VSRSRGRPARPASRSGNTGIVSPQTFRRASSQARGRRSGRPAGNTGIVAPRVLSRHASPRRVSNARGGAPSRRPSSVQRGGAGAANGGSVSPVQMRGRAIAALASGLRPGSRVTRATSPHRTSARALPARSLSPVSETAVFAAAAMGANIPKGTPLPSGLGRSAGKVVPVANLPAHKKATIQAAKWEAKGMPASVVAKKLHSISKERFAHKLAQGKPVTIDEDVARKIQQGRLTAPVGAAVAWAPLTSL